jgi:hypothetical protein
MGEDSYLMNSFFGKGICRHGRREGSVLDEDKEKPLLAIAWLADTREYHARCHVRRYSLVRL